MCDKCISQYCLCRKQEIKIKADRVILNEKLEDNQVVAEWGRKKAELIKKVNKQSGSWPQDGEICSVAFLVRPAWAN